MKPRPFLFSAAPEALGGNGPAAPVALTLVPEAPAAESTPETPAAESKPAGLLERISASIQTKGALLATGEAYRLRAETAEASLATATAELTSLRAAHAALITERADIAALLDTAVAEKQEVDTAVAVQIAALAFEPAALPAAGDVPETAEQLTAQLAATTDNATRFALAERINALG